MVERIGYLLTRGVLAGQIMVLMFNRSARDSFERTMKNRLGEQHPELPEIRTFHSLGLRLVTSFTKRGALPKYKLTTEDFIAERLARQTANEVYQQWSDSSEESRYLSGDDIEEFLGFIDRVKATVSDAGVVFKGLEFSGRLGFFPQAYEAFEQERKNQGIRFYSDLIHEPILAMVNNQGLADWVGNRVDHIIVDEYQDINETQQLMLKIVAGVRAEVMVVGDVDQCIYEWRGAKPDYITTRFAEDFAKPCYYQLSHTFRYGHQLSLAANHLIANNRKRDQKQCVSHHSTGPTSVRLEPETTGSHPVVKVVKEWLAEDRALSEAVVLVRLFASSVPVELALLEAGLPYRLEGGNDIFQCSEISALIGYLKLVVGTLGDASPEGFEQQLTAMFSQPHLGIRREEMDELVQEVIYNPGSASKALLEWSKKDYAPFIKKRFLEAAESWQWLSGSDEKTEAAQFLRKLVKRLKLYDFYHSFAARTVNAENRVKTCEAFIDFAASHKFSVVQLLEKIEEFRGESEIGMGGSGGISKEDDRLLITSVHRAKGLEWPLVVLPGLSEGSFPFYREDVPGEELEDERRLFYVATTRAIEQLVYCYPIDATYQKSYKEKSSQVPFNQGRASRFLYESNLGLSENLGKIIDDTDGNQNLPLQDNSRIEADNITVAEKYLNAMVGDISVELIKSKKRKARKQNKTDGQPPENPGGYLTITDIAEGVMVFHPSFGQGVVIAVRDRKQGRITVSFDEHGEMILLVAYAKLSAC